MSSYDYADYVDPEDSSKMQCPRCKEQLGAPKLSDCVRCKDCDIHWYLVQQWVSV